MANKPKGLTNDEIERVAKSEIELAKKYTRERGTKRSDAWDRYYGRKLGNEQKGRSQFITREVMDTVEWMLPYFIRTFATGDPKIEIEIQGKPPWVGKAMAIKISQDLADASPGHFTIRYQWFKDALVSDTSFLKLGWFLDQTLVSMKFDEPIGVAEIQQIQQDSDVTIESGDRVDDPFMGTFFHNVRLSVKKTIEDRLEVQNIPHWEFITTKRARDMNDEHPKGHRTTVTLDYLKRINRGYKAETGKDIFKELDELRGDAVSDYDIDSERQQYMDSDQSSSSEISDAEKGPKTPIEFVEWYTKQDVDKDGYLEDIVCYFGNDKMLGWQLNKEGFIPMCALKPIIDPYKFYGIAYSDLLKEIQNLKTMLFRRILDNFDWQNSGRWQVDPAANVDLTSLLDHSPGRPFFGKIDGVKEFPVKPFDSRSLNLLEYVDKLKSHRTGILPYSQDKPTETATGVMKIHSTILERLELIGRIFAETGIKDFYKKATWLYQRYLKRPFVVKVQGQEMEVTPDMIQGRVCCKVNMGIEIAMGFQEAQNIERMMGLLFQINQFMPGLFTPEKVHNLVRRYVTALGFRQVDDFISDVNTYVQTFTQNMQQSTEMQQRMMAMEEAMRQFQMQLEQAKVTQEGQVGMAKIKSKEGIEAARLEQKEREDVREMQVEQGKTVQQDLASSRDYDVRVLDTLARARTMQQQIAANKERQNTQQ